MVVPCLDESLDRAGSAHPQLALARIMEKVATS